MHIQQVSDTSLARLSLSITPSRIRRDTFGGIRCSCTVWFLRCILLDSCPLLWCLLRLLLDRLHTRCQNAVPERTCTSDCRRLAATYLVWAFRVCLRRRLSFCLACRTSFACCSRFLPVSLQSSSASRLFEPQNKTHTRLLALCRMQPS